MKLYAVLKHFKLNYFCVRKKKKKTESREISAVLLTA